MVWNEKQQEIEEGETGSNVDNVLPVSFISSTSFTTNVLHEVRISCFNICT